MYFYIHVVIFHVSGCVRSLQDQFPGLEIREDSRTQHVVALMVKIYDSSLVRMHRGIMEEKTEEPFTGFFVLSLP